MVTAPVLSDAVLIETARTLPAAPQVLAALSELLAEPNTGVDEIVDLLKRDAALCTRIVGMGNSAAFAASPVSSIEEAVSRVGFSEVYRLTGLATTARLVDRALVCYGVGAEDLREHVLCMALASEVLAGIAGLDPRRMYTAGLLRPVGMMVLDRAARRHLQPAPHYHPDEFPTYGQWELQVFERTNDEVAALLLEQWKFSPEIISAVRHHRLPDATALSDRAAVILNLAGWVAACCGQDFPGELSDWSWSEQKIAAMGVDMKQLNTAINETRTRFEQLRPALY